MGFRDFFGKVRTRPTAILPGGGGVLGPADLEGLIELSAAVFVYVSGAVNMILDRRVSRR